MAICEKTMNRGTLRKDIWNYLQTEFNDAVDYRDFLTSISTLEKGGKLINKTGYYFV